MDFIKELGKGLTRLSNIVDSQEVEIEKYRLKIAMYKAFSFTEMILEQIYSNK